MVVTTLEELQSLKLKARDHIIVKCDICGKEFETRAKRTDLHCKGCKTLIVKTANGTLKLSEETKKKISKSTRGRKVEISDEQKEKRKKTCLERYGGEPLSNSNIRDKIKKTNLQKYGDEVFSKSTIGRKKLSDASKASATKRRETCELLYGVPAATLIDGCKKRYTYDGMQFDSKWELAVWIYYTELGHNISRATQPLLYIHNNVEHNYYPDFIIDGELIEVKGPHFFENGKMVNPFDRSQDELYNAKYQCALLNNVKFITDATLYLNYVNDKYTKDYLKLFKNDLPFPYPEMSAGDLGLIRYFHKSLFVATRKSRKSPYEAWKDKDLVKASALNRLKYVGRCSPKDIIDGFSVAKIAPKVSVFKPTLAKELIQKYLSDADIIVDPFSGFSGRMLGAFDCGKEYFGYDINEDHIRESNEIIYHKKIDDKCFVEVQDLITASVRDWSTLKDVYLFTCPPYGGKEHWNENNDEVEMTCDEWIDLCIEKHKGCKKYLFVVDETEKYKNFIVDKITNRSHFGTNYEYVVLI